MRKPNTFIVGAPKCGTTALADYLSCHENVFVSNPKEPHYFLNKEMPRKSNFSTLASYLEIYREVTDYQSIVIDASVWYLFSSEAAKRIFEFSNEARIIVMLRRPDEMVYSMHNQALITFQENIKDFDVAWRMSMENEVRDKYPPLCKEPKLLNYGKIACYSVQVARYRNYFPDEQIKIVFYDDFKNQTAAIYSELLDFLELPADYRSEFPVINPSSQLRSELVGRFLKNPPEFLVDHAKRIKRFLRITDFSFFHFIRGLNSKKLERRPLGEKLRLEIIRHYRSDVLELQRITGRDLSHWLS